MWSRDNISIMFVHRVKKGCSTKPLCKETAVKNAFMLLMKEQSYQNEWIKNQFGGIKPFSGKNIQLILRELLAVTISTSLI